MPSRQKKSPTLSPQDFLTRLQAHPELQAEIEDILNLVDNAGGDALTADQVEELTAERLQRLGQQDAAMRIYRDDAAKHPGTVLSHQELARLAVQAHDFATAIAEIERAIAITPASSRGSLEDLRAQLRRAVDVNR